MPEKFRPDSGNGKEPETPEAETAKKDETVTLTIKEVADHIASKPELQEKIFGKILDEEELKKLEHNISPRIVMEVMEFLNLRPLTVDELLEVQGASPEEKAEARMWLKKLSIAPSPREAGKSEGFEEHAEWAPQAERVRDFSVVDLFEEIKVLLAKESPTLEELEYAKRRFIEIEEIRNEYITEVWSFVRGEGAEGALVAPLSLGKGGKDEITLIAPSEFFEVKARLESK